MSHFCLLFSCNHQTKPSDIERKKSNTNYECNSIIDALNDFRSQSSFVRIKFNAKKHNYVVIIQNTDLFAYFQKEHNFTKDEYKKEILKIIEKDSSINISNDNFRQFNDLIIKENTLKKSTVDSVLDTYFDKNKVMKMNVHNKLEVIEFLIQNSYKVWIDDESGYIIINKCDN